LQHGAVFAPPPPPGCGRAGLCGGIDEDQMTLWPAGGLGLAAPFLLDTHFSERTREWRLLRALAALPQQRWAIGVDETSAIRIERAADGGFIIEAIGARGGWLYDVGERACGQVAGTASYLAPGLRWQIGDTALLPADGAPSAAEFTIVAVDQATDALASGAVRAEAWRLATQQVAAATLAAHGARLELQRGPASRVWQAANGTLGVSGLRVALHFADGACRVP
jgi:hypothetical protein